MPEATLWTPTVVAAWVGATVSVANLGWQIFRAQSEQLLIKLHSEETRSGKIRIFIEVCNRGKPVTIVQSILVAYLTPVHLLFQKFNFKIIAPKKDRLPHHLPSGERWMTFMDVGETECHLAFGNVYVGVVHSGSSRPALARVTKSLPCLLGPLPAGLAEEVEQVDSHEAQFRRTTEEHPDVKDNTN